MFMGSEVWELFMCCFVSCGGGRLGAYSIVFADKADSVTGYSGGYVIGRRVIRKTS